MSHITLAQQGLAAAEAHNWDEAITKLSTALQSSANPAWLLARSRALVNVRRFEEALDDANLAWHKAYDRNKRPLMVDADYRRAVAYFRMGQFANADACCIYAMRLIKGKPAVEKEDPAAGWTDSDGFWKPTLADAMNEAASDPMNSSKDGGISAAMGQSEPSQAKEWRLASTMRMQILRAMESLPADDAARRPTTTAKPPHEKLADIKTEGGNNGAKPAAVSAPVANPAIPKDTPVRLQEFQNNTTMSVSIFSKGVNKERLQVEFLPSSVRLDSIIYPSGEEKEFVLELWGEIDIAASKYSVTPNKVELSLTKKSPGKWSQLKKDESAVAAGKKAPTSKEDQELEALKKARKDAMQAAEATTSISEATKPTSQGKESEPEAAKPAGATYPTSSRTGPKDWDKITENENDEDEQDVNMFFKKLYKNATPEQQRAMMKSFTESSGTSLSTDWNDVSSRTVEAVPPEGVDAKKWDDK